MFQFPPLTSLERDIPTEVGMGCPIRIPADHSLCATPRSFSQLYTSFIARRCLGIHHTPLCAFAYMACTASHITMTLDLCGGADSRTAIIVSYLLGMNLSASLCQRTHASSVFARQRIGRQPANRLYTALTTKQHHRQYLWS